MRYVYVVMCGEVPLMAFNVEEDAQVVRSNMQHCYVLEVPYLSPCVAPLIVCGGDAE